MLYENCTGFVFVTYDTVLPSYGYARARSPPRLRLARDREPPAAAVR